ncbi:hypothetical protein MtrunA17_Chr3g0130031 [Medicago truncatula]|uniref:Uncharacterized protein n=1 Tax=Medicago truncatula TaxID=3880 RepID=A0A396IWK1_MEDTR|nr:hypothetical protein MtrunA17_Chr3g0130031 [Medicago truncatula]
MCIFYISHLTLSLSLSTRRVFLLFTKEEYLNIVILVVHTNRFSINSLCGFFYYYTC